jgi:drug/metabolite transporter (DMT)-like permease
MNTRLTGALCCATGMTILGGSFAVSRSVLAFPTLTGQAIRYAIAAAVLLPLAVRRVPAMRRRPAVGDVVRLVCLAATGLVGFNICLLAALRHAQAPMVGTIVGVSPLVLAVCGPLLVGASPAPRTLGAAVIVVVGVAVVEGAGRADGVGLLFAVGTLAGEVLFSLLAVPLLDRYGPLGISACTCALAMVILVPLALASGETRRWRLPTGAEALAFGYLGLVLTVLAFLAWYAGLHRLGAARAGLFAGLLPVASLVAAMVLDGVVPPAQQLVGALIVATGLAVAARPVPARPVPVRPVPARPVPARPVPARPVAVPRVVCDTRVR